MLSNADYGSNIGMGGGFGGGLMNQNEFLRQPSHGDGFINPGSVIGGNIGGGNHHNHGG